MLVRFFCNRRNFEYTSVALYTINDCTLGMYFEEKTYIGIFQYPGIENDMINPDNHLRVCNILSKSLARVRLIRKRCLQNIACSVP